MLNSKLCGEVCGSNQREAATETCNNSAMRAQKCLKQDTICIKFWINQSFHNNIQFFNLTAEFF